MTTFTEQWLAAVEKKNSVLCAGFDPVLEEMLTDTERANASPFLKSGTSKLSWALNYLDDIAPFVAAIKPNEQFWKSVGDESSLRTLAAVARDEYGLVVIDDSKLADIGATNKAGVYAARDRGAHAVTVAPFAGNFRQAVKQGAEYKTGIIGMCLMSNSEYEEEKNQLIHVRNPDDFAPEDVFTVSDGVSRVRKYQFLAYTAAAAKADGIVIGAPSASNHISLEEIQRARLYAGDRIVLLTGLGKQGGEAAPIWKAFGRNRVIANVGTELMHPKDGNRAAAAKYYCTMLNETRYAA